MSPNLVQKKFRVDESGTSTSPPCTLHYALANGPFSSFTNFKLENDFGIIFLAVKSVIFTV